VLAAEEIGKCLLVDEAYWRAETGQVPTADDHEYFMSLIFRHDAKQGVFARDSENAIANAVLNASTQGDGKKDAAGLLCRPASEAGQVAARRAGPQRQNIVAAPDKPRRCEAAEPW